MGLKYQILYLRPIKKFLKNEKIKYLLPNTYQIVISCKNKEIELW